MFIAMNRFKVVPNSCSEFERVWTSRDTHLRDVPGFVEFYLLRGPERDDHVLYSSHTVWRSREDFEAWTRSEAFRIAELQANHLLKLADVLGPPVPTAILRDLPAISVDYWPEAPVSGSTHWTAPTLSSFPATGTSTPRCPKPS